MSFAVAVPNDVVVLLLDLIQLDLEFDDLPQCREYWLAQHDELFHLFTAVRQIPHERLLDTLKFCKLNIDRLAGALQVLGAFGQALATLDACRRHGESTLRRTALY